MLILNVLLNQWGAVALIQKKSYSYNYQKHEPSGFCFYIKGIVPGKTFKPILYTKKTPNDDIPSIFVSKYRKSCT